MTGGHRLRAARHIVVTYTCSCMCSKRVSSPSEDTRDSVRRVTSELSDVDLLNCGGLTSLDLIRWSWRFVGRSPTVTCASSRSFRDSAGSGEEDTSCCGLTSRVVSPVVVVHRVDRLEELPSREEEEKGEVTVKFLDNDGNHESGPDHERFLVKKPFCKIAFVLLDRSLLNGLGSGTRHGEGICASGEMICC